MKKFLYSVFLFAITGLAFTSCNNGPYDANPDIDNSGIPNPLIPGNVSLGTIRADINGTTRNFFPGFYISIDEDKIRSIGAMGDYGTDEQKTISFLFREYHGTGNYTMNSDALNGELNYITFTKTGSTIASYTSNTAIEGHGHANFNVEYSQNSRMLGTFDGVLYKLIIHEDHREIDLSDSIVVTAGKFFVAMQSVSPQ